MSKDASARRVLILTAVEAEREAVRRGLQGAAGYDVELAGVGPVAAAVNATKLLAKADGRYGLVVIAGIAGGFPGQAEVGSLVVSSEIIAADLGAESLEGFSSLDELGFGSARVPVDPALVARVTEALHIGGLPVTAGPVLTLSTVTGTAASAAELTARVPGAAAEGMEGYGVAYAAHDFGLPVLEVRAISNAVGPRDRSAWRIKDALLALEAASARFAEVF